MSDAARLIRQTRREAGLTQAQLAARLGVTQSAVAKLEREGANPSVATLGRAMLAMDRRLNLLSASSLPDVDDGQILECLRRTPSQRLAALTTAQHNLRRLTSAARRVAA